MKVFTSPVLRYNADLEYIVTGDALYYETIICMGGLEKYVDVPAARHYDMQVSRQQWADDSGVRTVLRWDGAALEGLGEWRWRVGRSTKEEAFETSVDDFLTECFGEPKRPITVYWRLRYWN